MQLLVVIVPFGHGHFNNLNRNSNCLHGASFLSVYVLHMKRMKVTFSGKSMRIKMYTKYVSIYTHNLYVDRGCEAYQLLEEFRSISGIH